MNELEASLKRSEESSAELAQGKAELVSNRLRPSSFSFSFRFQIKKNKDLEKTKKCLEEFNKKLGERQKLLNQENRQLEQKLKEAQDETIRTVSAIFDLFARMGPEFVEILVLYFIC